MIWGIEIEPDFANEWQERHREAALLQADIRALHASELPEFNILIGGIPCTSHSNLGRAKMSLAGKPELGDKGDLFLPVLKFMSERMPPAAVFENVPAFGSSLAGELFVSHLKRIGYHVSVCILEPNQDWGEMEDRRRGLLVATLDRPFALRVPCESATAPFSAYLDPPDAAQDREDAERIARTIQGLRLHNARHQAAGHGFAFTVVDGTELRLPVNPKAYHKINTGPFVQTAFGPRLLRQSEIERIQLRKRSWLSCFCRQVIVGMGHATTDCSTGGSPAG